MKGSYHYEYACYTDNLAWGRQLIGTYRTRTEAYSAGDNAGKGCFVVERKRISNS